MKKSRIKATTMRTAMIITLSLIIGLTATGFYFTQDWLRNLATKSNQTSSASTVDNNGSQSLQQIRDDITANQASADKADGMIASSQNYQTQIINDLNKYALTAGVSIVSHKSAQSPSLGVKIAGLESDFVTIALANPIPLKNLLQFFKLIETNLPKMQITGIDLTPTSSSSDSVTIEPITIGVYIR